MAVKVTIRKATTKDVSAIVELWKELMDLHKAVEPFFSRSRTGHKAFADFIAKKRLASENAYVCVAAAGKDIVGYCMANIEKYPPVLQIKEAGRIENLAVTKKWRNKGIGQRLLKKVRKWFSEKGVCRIEVRVSIANKSATRFWAKMGFKPYLETVFLEI